VYFFSCHPSQNIIATGSGQRHISVSMDVDSDSDVETDISEKNTCFDNSLKVWYINFNAISSAVE